MQTYEVAKGVDLDFGAAASGSAIDMSTAPLAFQPGASAVAKIAINNWAEGEAGAKLVLQGSDNAFSGWEDLATGGGGVTGCPYTETLIQIPAFLRWHSAGNTAGDGRGSIYLGQN
jgi:hypothetical protein